METVKNLHVLSDKNLKARFKMERAAYQMTSIQSQIFKALKAIKQAKEIK